MELQAGIVKMKSSSNHSTTPGDPDVTLLTTDEILPLVYEELRRLAGKYANNNSAADTIGATGLVHEAWLKIRRTLGEEGKQSFSDRHYYAMVAQAMRRILVDRARRKGNLRNGGGYRRLELQADGAQAPEEDYDIVALSRAIDRLEAESPVHAEIVLLKFFADRTHEQIGELIQASPSWVRRHWAYAKARLLFFMERE